jgi:hypothetical protein
MPQLDIVSFCSQFFWLCFFYGGFYMLCVKFFLPRLSRVLFVRYTKTHTTLENGQNDDTSEESFFSEHALRDAETLGLSHLVKGVNVTQSLCHSTIAGSMAKVRSAVSHATKSHGFKGPFAQAHSTAMEVLSLVTADTLSSTEAVSQSVPPVHSSCDNTTRAAMRYLGSVKKAGFSSSSFKARSEGDTLLQTLLYRMKASKKAKNISVNAFTNSGLAENTPKTTKKALSEGPKTPKKNAPKGGSKSLKQDAPKGSKAFKQDTPKGSKALK